MAVKSLKKGYLALAASLLLVAQDVYKRQYGSRPDQL